MSASADPRISARHPVTPPGRPSVRPPRPAPRPPEFGPAAPEPPPPVSLERARWVEERMREMRRYGIMLYNLLLDRRIPDYYKEHAFGGLWYLLEGGDLIPKEEPDLGGLDAAAFALRTLAELLAHLQPPALAIYEEALYRDGIPLREVVAAAYVRFGPFFQAVSAIYWDRIARSVPAYKNAIETGRLVRLLKLFLEAPPPPSLSTRQLEHIEAFLASFRLGG